VLISWSQTKNAAAFSVQVKTNARTFGFWLIGKKAKETVSATHIYVLVNIRNSVRSGEWTEFFVVRSKTIARRGSHSGNRQNISRSKILDRENDWAAFGKAA